MICYECNAESETHPHEYDGSPVCDECWKIFCVCINCNNTLYASDSVTHDGDSWCNGCSDDYWQVCSNSRCEEYVHNEDARYVGDDPYCEGCYDRNFTYIECCDTAIDNHNVYYGGSTAMCEEHYHESYGECNSCENTFHQDELYYNNEHDDYVCRRCNENREDNETAIHRYEHKPTPIFKKLAYENTLYMGVELEVENPNDLHEEADALTQFMSEKEIADRFYLKWDGSIKRDGEYSGFEIVSHPATLKFWHESKAWWQILDYLDNKGFKSYQGGKCGIHVHVSRASLDRIGEQTMSNLKKLALFFWYNKEWLKIFARRDSLYAKFVPYPLKESLITPVPTEDRHLAVNFCNRDTVEFRIFRGTLKHDRFTAYLQFVDAVCHFVQVASIMTCGKYCFDEFMAYLDNVNRYSVLKKRLSTLSS